MASVEQPVAAVRPAVLAPVPWTTVLDRMEDSLRSSAQLLARPGEHLTTHVPAPAHTPGPWTAPPADSTLPEEFAGRAADLLAAQKILMGRLEQALSETRRQLQAVVSVPSHRPAGGAVYLDVNG